MRLFFSICLVFFLSGSSFSQDLGHIPDSIIRKEYHVFHLRDSIEQEIKSFKVDSSVFTDRHGLYRGQLFDTVFFDSFMKPIKFVTSKILLNSKKQPRLYLYECYFLPKDFNVVMYIPQSISKKSLAGTLLSFESGLLFRVRGVYNKRDKTFEEKLLAEVVKYVSSL